MSTVIGGDRGRGMRATLRLAPFATTTHGTPSVDGVPSGLFLTRLAETLTERLLAPRQDFIASRAPRDRSVHQLRRDLACGKMRAMHALLRVSFADAEEADMPQGAPGDVYRLIGSMLDARQREVRHEGADAPSLLPLIDRENLKQCMGDRMERRVIADEESPEALQALIDACAVHITELDRVRNAAREKLANLTLEVAR